MGSAVDAARGFLCDLRQKYPNYLEGTAPYDALASLRNGVWNNICPNAPQPVPNNPPPWSGDTCACISYKIKFRVTRAGATISEGDTIAFTGPFYGLEVVPGSGTVESTYVRHGVCSGGVWTGTSRFLVLSAGNTDKFNVLSVVRQDGASNCPIPRPTPVPPPTAPTPTDQNRSAPITISPGVQIAVPIILVKPIINTLIKPEFEVNVGPVNVKFDLGGVTIDISPSYNPTFVAPSVNLPSLPPGQTRPTPLPPEGGGGQVCPDPCEPVELESIQVGRVVCELQDGKYTPRTEQISISVLKGESDAWKGLFNQFVESNYSICRSRNNPNVGATLIGSGVTTYTTRTQFFNVGNDVRSVFLRITNIANSVTLYTISVPGQEQGKFGNIALCVPGLNGSRPQWGDPGWVWSKETWYGLPEGDFTGRSLRLTLQAGLTFELYDSGERK